MLSRMFRLVPVVVGVGIALVGFFGNWSLGDKIYMGFCGIGLVATGVAALIFCRLPKKPL